MKTHFSILKRITVIAGMVIFMYGCNTAPTDVTSQIQDANNKLMAAYEQGDTTVLAGLYTTDAKIFPSNNQIVDGKEAISNFWSGTRQMGIKKVVFETTAAQKFGNVAVEEGKYSLFVPGDIMVDQGKYIVTWRHENGQWKIYRDIWNHSTPAPVQRAAANDTVMLVLNYVKPDKTQQFEDFYKNYLSTAGAETNPQAKATVRMQKPVNKNPDGTYTYTFLMDPFKGNLNYNIEYPLTAKFGKEKAGEYFKMYVDCLKGGTSQVILLVETDW